VAHRLFVYGTLRDPAVQRVVFGRTLPGAADALTGFRVGEVAIADPDVVTASGLPMHRILHPTGDPADVIEGLVLFVTDPDLAAADVYETAAYRRVAVTARSGASVFVYIAS